MRKNYNQGQSTLEYAILIACVVGALLAMQIYLKRAYQGKVTSSVDRIGEQFDVDHTTTHITTSRAGQVVQNVSQGVKTSNTGSQANQMVETRSSDETVGTLDQVVRR